MPLEKLSELRVPTYVSSGHETFNPSEKVQGELLVPAYVSVLVVV